jgi:hypothetical protein
MIANFAEVASILGEDVETVKDMYNQLFVLKGKDYITIGSTPKKEIATKINLNEPEKLIEFHETNKLECETLIQQLKRGFLKDFKFKDNLFIKKIPYEYSYYQEVAYSFISGEESEDYISFVEQYLPEKWDRKSKIKLNNR